MRLRERILHSDNLRQEWEEGARKKGAAGIDEVSIKRWRRKWEERLVNLAAAVRANTYQPRRLRRFYVPKRDGSPRQLSILTVTDRVLQRAVLRVVDDRFGRLFLACSCASRHGRGLRDAARAPLSALWALGEAVWRGSPGAYRLGGRASLRSPGYGVRHVSQERPSPTVAG